MHCCIDGWSDNSGLFRRREDFPGNKVTFPSEPFFYYTALFLNRTTNCSPTPIVDTFLPKAAQCGDRPSHEGIFLSTINRPNCGSRGSTFLHRSYLHYDVKIDNYFHIFNNSVSRVMVKSAKINSAYQSHYQQWWKQLAEQTTLTITTKRALICLSLQCQNNT